MQRRPASAATYGRHRLDTPERLAIKVLPQAAADGNVARVCRRFGISRKLFYKFQEARARHGDAGL